MRDAVAALLVAAAVVHLAVAPEHFREWVGYGAFFAICGGAQLAAAVLALYRPGPAVWRTAAGGSLLVIALLAVTRTTGLPFGPEPGIPERLGVADAVSSAFELLTAVLAFALLARRTWPPVVRTRLGRALLPLAAVALAGVTVLAVLDGTGALTTGAHVH